MPTFILAIGSALEPWALNLKRLPPRVNGSSTTSAFFFFFREGHHQTDFD